MNGGTTANVTYNALGQMVHNLTLDTDYSPAGQRIYGGSFNIVPWGNVALVKYGTNTNFVHGNALQSSTIVTYQTGGVLQDLLFYPWGQTWIEHNGNVDGAFATMEPLVSATGEETGITPNRSYSESYGRWLSPDPLGKGAADPSNPQTWNMYAYVRNNPTSLIDPLGLFEDCPDGYIQNNQCIIPSEDTDYGDENEEDVGLAWSNEIIDIDVSEPADRQLPPSQPQQKRSAGCLLQRAAAVAKAGINVGVGYLKLSAAAVAGITTPVDGLVGALGLSYLTIGATGNFMAAGAQLTGAVTGNLTGTGNFATLATTSTTVFGLGTLAWTRGNLEKASAAATLESLGTAGLNGGMTGSLIDEGVSAAANLLNLTDNGISFLDALGLDTTDACR